MKKMSTKNVSFLKRAALTGFVAGCALLSSSSFGQTYYSQFDDPAGKYQITNPGGVGCNATDIQNAVGMADNDDATFAYFTANTSKAFTCSQSYKFDVLLNLPVDSPYLSSGNEAGFKIKIPTGISPDSLGKYLIVASYLDGKIQEYKTGNLLRGLDAGQNQIDWYIYFVTGKPFNTLELVVDPKIVQLNKNFEFDVIAGVGRSSAILPAQIENFKASVSGKNVNLTWQSLNETNVANYRIERSDNGGSSYVAVGTEAAKGNSNTAIAYAHSNVVTENGSYLYRLVTVNNDGTSKATSSIVAVISGQSSLFLYPSVVKAGQSITAKTTQTGMVSVFIYNAEGRMVKQQRTSSNGLVTISTTGLTAGVYTIKLVSATGSVLQSRMVVN